MSHKLKEFSKEGVPRTRGKNGRILLINKLLLAKDDFYT